MNQTHLRAIIWDQSGKAIQFCFEATTQNIASVIVRNRFAEEVVIENIPDEGFLLNTNCIGFIDKCYDQKFLCEELLRVLAPMQMGETEPVEIKIIKDERHIPDQPIPDWNFMKYVMKDDEFFFLHHGVKRDD